MPDTQYLSVKNFDQYQHYKHRNPPWIKLYYALLDDPRFLSLSEVQQGRYIKLLLVASKQSNRIVNDPQYLARMLRIQGRADITPLIMAGFLIASSSNTASNALAVCAKSTPQSSLPSETDNSETESKPDRPRKQTDEEWLTDLKTNQAYSHIDLAAELGKMDAWLSTRPSRHKTRRFIVNWLNKIERPITTGGGQTPPPPPPKSDPVNRGLWTRQYGDPKEHGYE